MEVEGLPGLHSTASSSVDKAILEGHDILQQFLRALLDNRHQRKTKRDRNIAEERSLQNATDNAILEVSVGVLSVFLFYN